jgi:PAS domain S-box-containing protein
MPLASPTWAELSWLELADRLRELQATAGGPTEAQSDPARLLHELQVHQVELEMQNRELREAQGRLEASRARYAELFDRAPIGYARLDRNGIILEINLTAAGMLRRPRELLLETPFGAAARLRDRVGFLSLLRESSIERSQVSADFEVVDADGAEKTLQASATPDVRQSGERFFLVTMTDVTEKRRVEAEHAVLEAERRARLEADAANRMKDQFLGIVSHELRTPLNAILGWAQVLNGRLDDSTLVARGLDAMQRSARGLARIVDDILDVSRIATGKLSIERERADLEQVLRAALEQAKAAAQAKRIDLRFVLQAGCQVDGDSGRLEQVASNLLSNAIKFSALEGVVEVQLEGDVDAVTFSVRDDGVGIDAADLPTVFDSFRQADHAPTRVNSGLGLGLAIARHIVEAHRGTVVAQSGGRGRGTTLVVRLPRGDPAAAHTHDGAPESPAPIDGAKVLYVDDATDALDTVRLMLEPLGVVVRTAASVDEALQLVEAFEPDLVLSDLAMPDRDGYDLLRTVRRLRGPARAFPIVALTAYARPEDAARILAAGFAAHLAKPVDTRKLVAAIGSLLHRRAATPAS